MGHLAANRAYNHPHVAPNETNEGPLMSPALLLPVLVGIIAAKRIHPIWNFLLMNFVFQLVAVAVVFPARGFRPFLLIAPYVISFVVPCIVGIFAVRKLGEFATFVIIIGTFYVWGVLLVLMMDGHFKPVRFLGGLFLSEGALVPPLVFVLVAILASKRRVPRRDVEQHS